MQFLRQLVVSVLLVILLNLAVFTSRVENSVDSDQLASEKPVDLDLHCFQNRIYPGLAW